jgi:heptosyltransferase-2
MTATDQRRPRTAVVHHRSGIGDLVWHIPYFRAIAAHSKNGLVTVIARPSCRATDILAGEPTVEKVIEYDYKPRKSECRTGLHQGVLGQLAFISTLRRENLDRIFIFAGRFRYALLALFAGIQERAGFGFSRFERFLLNKPPFIARYRGGGSWVYPEATAFAKAHGFVDGPVVPRLAVPERLLLDVADLLSSLPPRRIAFAIGSSEARKQWGTDRFARLAAELATREAGVVLLGGPAEAGIAGQIVQTMPETLRQRVLPVPQRSVLHSAAILRHCHLCVGNDTGVLSVAAACEIPAIGLFGATHPLLHDPLIEGIIAENMARIPVGDVLDRIEARLKGPLPTLLA